MADNPGDDALVGNSFERSGRSIFISLHQNALGRGRNLRYHRTNIVSCDQIGAAHPGILVRALIKLTASGSEPLLNRIVGRLVDGRP